VTEGAGVDLVLFHSRGDRPYGAFSNFAATAIWIAGRKYPTVEHWYQAMKTVGDGHEWIRSASTPEEAKDRGHSIQARQYWRDEKVFIMYRGVLAKFRQHPDLARLLLSTGDAPIHENCDDPFWGFNGASGEDWLGRVLTHVRVQLRDVVSTEGPLSGVLRGRFLNYQTAFAVRYVRNGGEPWLVHLIRYRDSAEPAAALRSIVESGVLRATRQLNGYYAVCFSAAPVHDIELRVFDVEARLRRAGAAHVYSPFGIAVTYDFARELGIRPVLPLPTELIPELPAYLRFLTQGYSTNDLLDYTHEDEWRAPADVNVREGPFALVIPERRRLRLLPMAGSQDRALIMSIETAASAQ